MRWSYHPLRTVRRVLRRAPDGGLAVLSSARVNWVYMRYERAVASAALSHIRERGPWSATPRVASETVRA